MQLTHHTSKFKSRKFQIVLVCDGISNAANVGGLFRLADAFGVEKLIFCGPDFSLGKRFKITSRSTEKVVDFCIEKNIESTVDALKQKGYAVFGLEITTESKPISQFKITDLPIALIVGNEIDGISASVLHKTDQNFHISMYGQNSSMNVTQATGIALFHITNSILELNNK